MKSRILIFGAGVAGFFVLRALLVRYAGMVTDAARSHAREVTRSVEEKAKEVVSRVKRGEN